MVPVFTYLLGAYMVPVFTYLLIPPKKSGVSNHGNAANLGVAFSSLSDQADH
jgi:hypothetical protein